MTDPLEKVAAMQRMVISYKETGQIYAECLLLSNDAAIAVFRDSDFPAYMLFQGNDAMSAKVNLLEFVYHRPEWPNLAICILDRDSVYHEPLTGKFFNDNWQEVQPTTYKEVK